VTNCPCQGPSFWQRREFLAGNSYGTAFDRPEKTSTRSLLGGSFYINVFYIRHNDRLQLRSPVSLCD